MKKLLSFALACLMVAISISLVLPASAQRFIALRMPAYTVVKSTEQAGAQLTSTMENVTLSGRTTLKVTPYNAHSSYPNAEKITLNCYSLSIDPADLVGVNYVAIKYKYETTTGAATGKHMGIIMMPHSGGLAAWVKRTSDNTIIANEWSTMIIPVGDDFTSKLVTTGGKKISQLQIYMAGGISDDPVSPSAMQGDTFYFGDIEFWSGVPQTTTDGPDYIVLNAADYNYAPAEASSANVSRAMFEGRDCAKIEFNTNYNGKTVFYGWKYKDIFGEKRIDLQKYKYAMITYYLDGGLKAGNGKARMRIGLPQKAGLNGGAYWSGLSTQVLYNNDWNSLTFNVVPVLDQGYRESILINLHLTPLADINNTELNPGTTMYISKIVFSKTRLDPNYVDGYIRGDGQGNFNPADGLTRAQAATMISRIVAGGEENVPTGEASYTDVSYSDWYGKYVYHLETLNFLTEFSDSSFLPDEYITTGEFTNLIYKLLRFISSENVGDVSFGAGDGRDSITRAEAVVMLNAALGRSATVDKVEEAIDYLYYDVAPEFWAYADICDASLAHYEDENGSWISPDQSVDSLYPEITEEDFAKGAQYVKDIDKVEESRIKEIRNTASSYSATGTTYYVSSSEGNDSNSGTSESRPWKTLKKVNSASLKSGDVVLFKRGDIWRENPGNEEYGRLIASSDGVTYSAYGEGAKPVLMGSPENGADPSKWTLVNAEKHIYRYATQMTDVGLVVMNPDREDAVWCFKQVPSLINGKFYVRGTGTTTPFDVNQHMEEDLDFFCDIPTNNFRFTKGYLYLRCDKGNPGDLFDSIEFATHINVISGASKNNLTFDNLCVKYGGAHGIGTGSNTGLTVRNCEFGWIGGSYQYYNGTSGAVRFGNAVEIYGQAQNYLVENNYIYQCYDAGITHQFTADGTNRLYMKNITYRNNLVTDCIYNIEHFIIDDTQQLCNACGENLLIENNILRRAGYGFGITRPNGNPAANIQGRSGSNLYKEGTYIVRNNIMDRSSYALVNCNATYDYALPVYEGNTWVQVIDRMIGFHNTDQTNFDRGAAQKIKHIFGDKTATVYFLDPSYAYYYRGVQY